MSAMSQLQRQQLMCSTAVPTMRFTRLDPKLTEGGLSVRKKFSDCWSLMGPVRSDVVISVNSVFGAFQENMRFWPANACAPERIPGKRTRRLVCSICNVVYPFLFQEDMRSLPARGLHGVRTHVVSIFNRLQCISSVNSVRGAVRRTCASCHGRYLHCNAFAVQQSQ